MQLLILWAWDGAWDSAFLTGLQVVPSLLAPGSFEEQGFIRALFPHLLLSSPLCRFSSLLCLEFIILYVFEFTCLCEFTGSPFPVGDHNSKISSKDAAMEQRRGIETKPLWTLHALVQNLLSVSGLLFTVIPLCAIVCLKWTPKNSSGGEVGYFWERCKQLSVVP